MRHIIFRKEKSRLALLNRVIKWHIYYYLLGKPFPLYAGIYITNRCNYRCVMCNIWRNQKKSIVPIDIFRNIVDDLSKMGCYYLSFSGGEPLLVKDIFERIAYAKKKMPYVHMVTNGFLLDEKVAKKLAGIGIDDVAVSIDGIGKAHDNIRGVVGAYDRAVRAIENLKKYSPKTKIVINTIVSSFNIEELYNVADLAEKLKVYQKFQPINWHPIFEKQKTRSKKWSISKEQINQIKKFAEFAKKKKFILNSKHFLDNLPNYFAKNLKGGIFNEDCELPYFYCEFNERGEIFPCLTAMDWRNGFSLKKGLFNVFRSKAYKQKQKELEKCRICKRDMYVCYLEPRMTFPITKFFRYTLLR